MWSRFGPAVFAQRMNLAAAPSASKESPRTVQPLQAFLEPWSGATIVCSWSQTQVAGKLGPAAIRAARGEYREEHGQRDEGRFRSHVRDSFFPWRFYHIRPGPETPRTASGSAARTCEGRRNVVLN